SALFAYNNSGSDDSYAIQGVSNGATGQTTGVLGQTNSASDFTAGVQGFANGTTGWNFGVVGQTNSDHDLSAGVLGLSKDTGTGTSIGVLGVAQISTATAGVFADTTGTGKILSGRSGGGQTGPFPEVFAVQSTGDVISRTGDFQALAAGKGLILKSPNGAVCARLSIDNAGTLVTAVIACP